MLITSFYTQDNNQVIFSREQASSFAKQIADDFNPIHNVDAKRFCVPGDLLFAITLAKAGLYQKMEFTFSGMVTDNIPLNFPIHIENKACVTDDKEKEYLNVAVSGERTTNDDFIDQLTKAYVEFSGHTFPHILVQLMSEHQVMINPTRPMVMYERMTLELDSFEGDNIELVTDQNTLTIDGKRGSACLAFDLTSNGKVIGHGKKYMMLSGLRPYCNDTMQSIVDDYKEIKRNYQQ
ncbi:DUF3581 family protein [Thalassotalea eurytherma]|uniref:DUF3581 family protein n=1 Tax=Thalassotalea eurytherma TaxID=1144278 RepID=A0ABQ6H3S8_9GAMM|nr:DUF3581 family protein [Thalassotalea eurytherma]GLX82823.1 hypothetical protein theurythT_22750 [Thalassotalea eurytherma]